VNHIYDKGWASIRNVVQIAAEGRLAGKRARTISKAKPPPRGSPTCRRSTRVHLREPADSRYSDYLWTRMNGLETEASTPAPARGRAKRTRTAGAMEVHQAVLVFLARAVRPTFSRSNFRRIAREQDADPALRGYPQPPPHSPSACTVPSASRRGPRMPTAGVINPSEKGARRWTATYGAICFAAICEPNRRLAMLLGPDFDLW